MRTYLPRIFAVLLVASALDVDAASQRTFVRSDGVDPGNLTCSLANPCRSFNVAIGNTNSGGEVVILDTAGYGAMTIGKSIKIIGPSGVYGGISVSSGDGVTINAGSADVITLRGLDITGLGGIHGINILNAGSVHIEKSSISNFTQDASNCVRLDTATSINVYVVDSLLRECRTAISINGTGPTSGERPSIEIDNTRIEHSLNTVLTGTSGLKLTGNFAVALRNSIVAGNGDGIFASNSIATAQSRAYVINSHLTRSGNAAVEMAGGNNASLLVNISNSVLNLNDAAILLGHGSVRLSSSIITNNTNSIVNCGGVSANVVSLGYSASAGSNLITDFTNTTLPGGCTSFITPTILVGQ